MNTQRTCANCGAIAKKGIYCRDCHDVWLIAEHLANYMPDPCELARYIDDLESSKIDTPNALVAFATSKGAKAMRNMALRIAVTNEGRCLAEIATITARGYKLAKRNAKRLEAANAAKETMAQLPSHEAELLHMKIKRETWAKMGHIVEWLDGPAYTGFDPTKTDTDEQTF